MKKILCMNRSPRKSRIWTKLEQADSCSSRSSHRFGQQDDALALIPRNKGGVLDETEKVVSRFNADLPTIGAYSEAEQQR